MFNNRDLLLGGQDVQDKFFLTGTYNSGIGHSINIDPAGPIVSQRQDNAKNGVLYRKDWDNPDTRAQLQNISNNRRLIGAGGIVSIQIGNEAPLTVLFEKTGGPSKGKMASATGLSDRRPLETMIAEIAEETGIIKVDRQAKKLTFYCVTPNESLATVFNRQGLIKELMAKKQVQIQTIREQLDPEISNWPIEIEHIEVGLNPADENSLSTIMVTAPYSTPSNVEAIVSDNYATANINLMLPVLAQFPEGTEIITLDPEEFKRPISLFRRDQMLTEGFINTKASGPMKPYLQRALDLDF